MKLTPEQLTKNLLKSVRKGHKQSKEKIAEQNRAARLSHNWSFDHCLDCGCSQYDRPVTDECPERVRREKEGTLEVWYGRY